MINISLEEKYKCCGCTACAQICPSKCIKMQEDSEGFLYPSIDREKCSECGMCEKVCPILQRKAASTKFDIIAPKAMGGWHKNDEVRRNSSSGGAFTLLAEMVLKNNGVVYGAATDRNLEVVHIGIDNMEDLNRLRGSKYVQSNIGNCYLDAKKQLEYGKMVLFSGTPCQLAGLNSFLGKNYERLITCDFICHGVPSPRVFKKYISHLENKYNDKITQFRFRNKEKGWKQYGQTGTITKFKSGKEIKFIPAYKDRFMNGFLDDLYLRPSCYKCEFKVVPKYFADITIADFWGVASLSKNLYDKKGTSLLIINSKKGEEVFNKVKENFFYEECNFELAIRRNQCLIKSVDIPKTRNRFFEDLENLPFEKLSNKYMAAYLWAIHKILKILGRKW